MSKQLKKLNPHIDYVEECLELLKDRLDDCNDYLNTVKWSEKETQDDMEKEFKFQAGLFNNYITWLEAELGVPIRIISVGPDREQTIVRYRD